MDKEHGKLYVLVDTAEQLVVCVIDHICLLPKRPESPRSGKRSYVGGIQNVCSLFGRVRC